MTPRTYPSQVIGAFTGKVFFAVATLPAANAFVVTDDIIISGQEYARLYIQYERVAAQANSGFLIMPEYSPFVLDAEAAALTPAHEAWYQETNVQVNAVAAGADTANTMQGATFQYEATANGVETIQVLIKLEQNVERLRISIRELLAQGDPGDFGMIVELF